MFTLFYERFNIDEMLKKTYLSISVGLTQSPAGRRREKPSTQKWIRSYESVPVTRTPKKDIPRSIKWEYVCYFTINTTKHML